MIKKIKYDPQERIKYLELLLSTTWGTPEQRKLAKDEILIIKTTLSGRVKS